MEDGEGKEGGRKEERKGRLEREKEGEGRKAKRERKRKGSSALAFSHLKWRYVRFLEKLCLKEGQLIGISNFQDRTKFQEVLCRENVEALPLILNEHLIA